MQRGRHGCNDIGLRNGLAASDGQGQVIVCVRTQLLGHKFMPRQPPSSPQHAAISDASAAQLLFNHFYALQGVFLFLKHG